jgi:hypothetical protein
MLHEKVQELGAPVANANEAHSDFFVCADDATWRVGTKRLQSHRQTGNCKGGFRNKFSTILFGMFLHHLVFIDMFKKGAEGLPIYGREIEI